MDVLNANQKSKFDELFSFKILHQNLHYIRKKHYELNLLLDEAFPRHFVGSERSLKAREIGLMKLNEFVLISSFCRSNARVEGIALFVKQGFSYW